jgi:hypothetical protein
MLDVSSGNMIVEGISYLSKEKTLNSKSKSISFGLEGVEQFERIKERNKTERIKLIVFISST